MNLSKKKNFGFNRIMWKNIKRKKKLRKKKLDK